MCAWRIEPIYMLAGNKSSDGKKHHANTEERRGEDRSYFHLRSSIWSLKSHRGRAPQAMSIVAQATAPTNGPIGLGSSIEAQYTSIPGSIKTCRIMNSGVPR